VVQINEKTSAKKKEEFNYNFPLERRRKGGSVFGTIQSLTIYERSQQSRDKGEIYGRLEQISAVLKRGRKAV